MARKTIPLTDTPIKANTPKDKDYALFDGGGMYLLVKSNGSKIWCFKYTRPYTPKGALISFGSYSEISLQQATKQMELNNTFYAIAERWFKFKTDQGLEEVTLKKAWRSLQNHVFPYIKEIPVSQVRAVKTIKALQSQLTNLLSLYSNPS